jgi:hypothetical protein
MTLRDPTNTEHDSVALWLALGAFVAYWWFMLRATRSLLRSAGELGAWFRTWREEDRRC